VGKGEPTLLATISGLDPIWFHCAISEVDYLRAQRAALEEGRQVGELPVHLILADGSMHPEPGRWIFVDRAVDVGTGTIRARAEFPNPSKLLRPGMFARARISLRKEGGQILVPERAIFEIQGRTFVWVVGGDNKTTQRKVELAVSRHGENLIVLDGLSAGDRIVVEGLQKVHENGVVNPMTAEQFAAMRAAGQANAKTESAPSRE
jgi:membrane fusion protein (multidrug efflux system)